MSQGSILAASTALPQQQSAFSASVKMASKMALNVVAVAGFRWMLLERKKELSLLFSTTYRRRWKSVDLKLERETSHALER